MLIVIQMNLFIVLLLALILFHVNKIKYGRSKTELRLYNIHLLSVMFSAMLEAAGWLVDTQTFAGAHVCNHIINTATFLFYPVPGLVWFLFVCYKMFGSFLYPRKYWPLLSVPLLVNSILSLTNGFTGLYFTIDAANVYHRGSLFYFATLLFYSYAILAAMIALHKYLICRGNSENKRSAMSLMLYPFLCMIGGVLQILFYGTALVWMGVALAISLYYISYTIHQLNKIHLLEDELTQSQIAIMLSQIRPHFLYNSLVAIQELCYDNSEKAAEAVGEFSKYLRSNLDSLTMKEMIPFEKEMHHVNNYLSLEKKRFEEKLTIVSALTVQNFSLPPLTLQPIVENAVRHGVTKREEGGTVTISTIEADTAFVITVHDDGIGFDPDAKTNGNPSERSHIGTENVKNRLAAMCGGTLTIKSKIGIGTTVKIVIPKEQGGMNG